VSSALAKTLMQLSSTFPHVRSPYIIDRFILTQKSTPEEVLFLIVYLRSID
jgi:hypothetical protein